MSLKRFDIRKPLSSFRDRLSPIFVSPTQELKTANNEIDYDAAEKVCPEPDHLYVLVHGFNSKPGHLKYIAEKMRETLGANHERCYKRAANRSTPIFQNSVSTSFT
jgi:hypothetical protein